MANFEMPVTEYMTSPVETILIGHKPSGRERAVR